MKLKGNESWNLRWVGELKDKITLYINRITPAVYVVDKEDNFLFSVGNTNPIIIDFVCLSDIAIKSRNFVRGVGTVDNYGRSCYGYFI